MNAGYQIHSARSQASVDVEKFKRRKEIILDKLVSDPILHSVYKDYLGLFRAYSFVFYASAYYENGDKWMCFKSLIQSVRADLRMLVNVFFWKVLGLCILR